MNSRSLRHTLKWKKKGQLVLSAFRQLLKVSKQVRFKQSASQHTFRAGKSISNFGISVLEDIIKPAGIPSSFISNTKTPRK